MTEALVICCEQVLQEWWEKEEQSPGNDVQGEEDDGEGKEDDREGRRRVKNDKTRTKRSC